MPTNKEVDCNEILDSIDEYISSFDKDWNFLYLNKKTAKDFGFRQSDLIGKNFWKTFPRFIGTDFEKVCRQVMDKREVQVFEWKTIYVKPSIREFTVSPSAKGITVHGKDITERKKAEEALEQTKNKLQNILNGIEDGITLVGLDGKVLDSNEASMKLLGFTSSEFIGTNVYDAIVDEDKQQAINGASEVLKTGKVVNEVRVKRKNKPNFWAEISVTALCDKNGKPTLFLGVTRDITERKKLETALKLSEEKFSKAFLNSPFAVSLTCLNDGKIIEANDSAASLFGCNRQDVIGRTTVELHMWAKPEERDKFIQELASSGVVQNRELSFCKRDGTIFLVLLSASLIEIQGEKHFLSTFFDITERKKAEEALREAEEKFRSLVESTSDIIWQVDENAVYNYVSPKVKDILGYKPDEVVGKTPFDFIDEIDENRITDAFLEISNKKEPFYGLENWNIHKNGSRVLLETSGVPILDEKGQLAGYRGIDRDITERKKLQQELEKYTKDLERIIVERTKQLQEKERLATIGQTAGMVGHDIRNPLQAIVSELYLEKENIANLPDGEVKQETLESITFIQEQIDYINKIVADLQDYARQTKPTISEIEFKELMVDTFTTINVPSNILLKIFVQPNLKAMSDANFLRRIITNLASNAIQAMPNGGKLNLGVRRNDDKIEITVQDTGHGIPDKVKDDVFKPLFTTKSKGQGFGLAVAKKFVEQLGGTINFESEDGKGTTFKIELPIQQ